MVNIHLLLSLSLFTSVSGNSFWDDDLNQALQLGNDGFPELPSLLDKSSFPGSSMTMSQTWSSSSSINAPLGSWEDSQSSESWSPNGQQSMVKEMQSQSWSSDVNGRQQSRSNFLKKILSSNGEQIRAASQMGDAAWSKERDGKEHSRSHEVQDLAASDGAELHHIRGAKRCQDGKCMKGVRRDPVRLLQSGRSESQSV
mmetsp:Transcript_63660/g.110953  ORF Transcript_63660/g.110953 Transcript_63660/m.110953 type:complete len:199 (-) Transcript_63660:93-689(-)